MLEGESVGRLIWGGGKRERQRQRQTDRDRGWGVGWGEGRPHSSSEVLQNKFKLNVVCLAFFHHQNATQLIIWNGFIIFEHLREDLQIRKSQLLIIAYQATGQHRSTMIRLRSTTAQPDINTYLRPLP